MNLQEAIKAASPHTNKVDTVLAMTGLKITGGILYATDRYTAVRIEVPDTDDAWIPLSVATQGILSISGNVATLKTGATMNLPAQDEWPDYPTVEHLFEGFRPWSTGSPDPLAFGLAPAMFEKFLPRHFPRNAGAVKVEIGETLAKPLRITLLGFPEFVALWVPVKITTDVR